MPLLLPGVTRGSTVSGGGRWWDCSSSMAASASQRDSARQTGMATERLVSRCWPRGPRRPSQQGRGTGAGWRSFEGRSDSFIRFPDPGRESHDAASTSFGAGRGGLFLTSSGGTVRVPLVLAKSSWRDNLCACERRRGHRPPSGGGACTHAHRPAARGGGLVGAG